MEVIERVYQFLNEAGTYFLATVDGNMQMLYFKDATDTFSSFTSEPETIRF